MATHARIEKSLVKGRDIASLVENTVSLNQQDNKMN